MAYSILLIDDDEDVLTSLSLYLKIHFSEVVTSQNPTEINDLISQNGFDLVLLDMNFSPGLNHGKEGLYWLNRIKEINPAIQVILLTAYGSIDLAVASLQQGAADFVVKPWNNQKLLHSITKVLELKESKHQLNLLQKVTKVLVKQSHTPLLQSKSQNMQEVLEVANKVAPTNAHVLIRGENGTGKEVMARFLHEQSARAEQPFISLDMGAINENLFEAELFGYKKGAFTDAKEDKIGRFELAQGGTLFLDEIGNIPVGLQAKLLTVIQSKSFVPLGATQTQKIDCRLLCATNLDLSKAVEEGRFRQDLLFRINTIELEVPPLRKRTQDIPALAFQFLKYFNQKYSKTARLAERALEHMLGYSWPGNIRELRHLMERCVILHDTGDISVSDLNLEPIVELHDDKELADLEVVEKRHIARVLQKMKGNISHTAQVLKINRNTLYRKMEKYGL